MEIIIAIGTVASAATSIVYLACGCIKLWSDIQKLRQSSR